MKQLILWAIGMILALVLFVGLVATFLIFQGRASDLSLDKLLGRAPLESPDKDAAHDGEATKPPEVDKPSAHDLTVSDALSADDVQSLVAELKREKEKVLKLRAQVEAEQQELERQKVDIAMREQQVEQILSETTLKHDNAKSEVEVQKPNSSASQSDEATLKTLASEYSSMDPNKAAQILKAMKDQTMAVQVLALMKAKSRAKLLESIDSETAAKYAEQMRELKASQADQGANQGGTATKK